MPALTPSCPYCSHEWIVTELYCRHCDVTTRGRFTPGPLSEFDDAQLSVLRRFARLSPEQLALLDAFVRNEGRLTRLQEELGISYPTLRVRLNEMMKVMGYTPQEEEKVQKQERRQILDDLAAGKISAAEATALLREARP